MFEKMEEEFENGGSVVGVLSVSNINESSPLPSNMPHDSTSQTFNLIHYFLTSFSH